MIVKSNKEGIRIDQYLSEELDLSSKEAFETSVVLKKITEDEMWKWDKYSKFRKNNKWL